MLHLALSFRMVMLLASFGAAIGALLMFWEGYARLVEGLGHVGLAGPEDTAAVTTAVMRATDAFLFGTVLIIFAYAIAFGFGLDLPSRVRERLPAWMRIETIDELKRTLIEVIVVYLVVDFATDIAETETHLSWEILALPLAILVIAAAVRLLRGGGHEDHAAPLDRAPPSDARRTPTADG